MSAAEIFSVNVMHGYIVQILLAEALFYSALTRRKGFVWRAVVGIAVYALVSLVLTNLIIKLVPGFTSFIIFLVSVGLCCFCFKDRFTDVLFFCIGAQLLQNVAHNIELLFYLPFADRISSVGWFFLSAGVMLAVYAAGYFLIVRKLISRETINLKSGGIFCIAIVSTLFCYLMQFLFQLYNIDKMWVTVPPLLLCDLLALVVQFGLVIYKNRNDENIKLESMLAGESKMYDAYKNSINIINMKAHDLKHFIAGLDGSMDDGGLSEIKTAVEMYEQTANTGNKALDVVLTEKLYLCNKHGISLSFMADGSTLSFLHTSDLVSLVGNALDNAIEHERTVRDKSKRCIMFKIYRKASLVSIHTENYCDTSYELKDGLPESTKGDGANHGFGLKSMRYIARKYDGDLTVKTENGLFILDIVIPVPEN